MILFNIKQNDVNLRLDNFLRKTFSKISLTDIYKIIRTKKVKVNDKKCETSYRLKLNDNIKVFLDKKYLSKTNDKHTFLLSKNKLDIVYQDENIMLVNKPVGLLTHGDDSNNHDTLINRIKKYLIENKQWDYLNENQFAPALANRLDRNTSGLVIVAKNAQSLKILNSKIKNREIKKFYLAKVHGVLTPKSGTLTNWLTKYGSKNFVKVSSKPINSNSKQIITAYKTISHNVSSSLLEIELITGRTHQIRAHLSYIKHPLIGEKKYINANYSDEEKYQSLCSYKIIFEFKTDAGVLNYLKNKFFVLNHH